MCPTQLRNKSGDLMHSERMSMPKWAKSAATVLSDKQIEFKQRNLETQGIEDGPLTPAHAKPVLSIEEMGETVGGTVSRKDRAGKWGFTCENCQWVPKDKEQPPDWIPMIWKPNDNENQRYMPAHWPDRCRRCKSRMKRWTCAARKYDQLEILRQLEGRHCLRFVTFTRESWNVTLPCQPIYEEHHGCPSKHKSVLPKQGSSHQSRSYYWDEAEKLKKKAVKQFKNFRFRNKYWKSREAKGQAYYECTMKPVWNGWGFDEVQLHFHIHMVVCSKRIENKDIQVDLDTLESIPMSTTIQREWGGIVDVRKCRTWEHKDGEVKTSKRFVMNYLVDYINKSPHWQSVPFGNWSN